MTELEYNVLRKRECEELIPRLFHVYLPVKRFLSDDIETGPNSYAVLFESGHDVYALIKTSDNQPQTLGDVHRAVKNMGLITQRFFPPGADPEYFFEEGKRHFIKAYPGRKVGSKADISLFYQSLAAYPVGLVRVARVDGEVRRYNTRSGTWQKAFDYRFTKVPVAAI